MPTDDNLQPSWDALAQSKAYADSVLYWIVNSVIVTDAHGFIRMVNPATQELLGYSEAELIGQPLSALLAERTMTFDRPSWEAFLGRGVLKNVEAVYRSKHGKEIPILFSGSVMRASDGTVRGVVCVAQDITERKYLEQLKDDFISMVSHELRTPLTTISSGISLMLEGLLGEITSEQGEFLRTIEQNTMQLMRWVETLLDLSALKSGKLKLAYSEVDVASIIQDVCELYRSEAGNRRLIHRVTAVPRLLLDRKRVRRVLGHLVENAIHYTQADGTITIAVRPQECHLALSVTDDGVGIPQEDLGKLFRKFVKLNSKAFERPGSGIGLFFCKKIIELHGGTIHVASEVGRGSSFTCLLPLPGPVPSFP